MDKKNLIIKLFKSLRGEKDLLLIPCFSFPITAYYFEGTIPYHLLIDNVIKILSRENFVG
jgi:hypothetical protein